MNRSLQSRLGRRNVGVRPAIAFRGGIEKASHAVVTVCGALILMGPAFAADPQPPVKPASPHPAAHTVVVPYDHSKPAADQEASQYYLDYQSFERLWKAAKTYRQGRGEKSDAVVRGPKDHILTSALYRIEGDRKKLQVEARLSLLTRGGAWQKVPIPFKGVNISAIDLDGAPASYQQGAILECIEHGCRFTLFEPAEGGVRLIQNGGKEQRSIYGRIVMLG